MLNKLKIWTSKIRPETKYILLLFLATRITLAIIGMSTQILMHPYHGQQNVWHYSTHKYLDSWGVWDTGWYLGIAEHGYSNNTTVTGPDQGQANYAFFPLYPILIKIIQPIFKDFFISSLIISNLALLISCKLIYKLVKLEHDHETSLRAIKYLLIYPVSFIFSGGFTESLFICLLLACFYFAKTNRWALTGAAGFFLALTRSLGVFAILPLSYIYLKNHNFDYKKMKYNLFWLLLIPVGLLAWSYYNYRLTGDWLAFATVQSAWDRVYANPLSILYDALKCRHIHVFVAGMSALSVLLLINIFYKKIGFAYWLVGMYSILIPMATGIASLPRFTLAVFPIFIILADLSKNKLIDQSLTINLTLLQGFFMVFWAEGFNLIV